MYKIPAKRYRTEETIKRSRFIAIVAHAFTEEDAKAFVPIIKNEFRDATHNCWAYVAGPPGDTARIGMSDDGEPHGTAGKPILTVLLHSEIGEIVAVVTRYFGGTKLGTGGFVRAYSGSVKNALAGLSIKEKRDVITLTAILDYSKIIAVRQMIESFISWISNEQACKIWAGRCVRFPLRIETFSKDIGFSDDNSYCYKSDESIFTFGQRLTNENCYANFEKKQGATTSVLLVAIVVNTCIYDRHVVVCCSRRRIFSRGHSY